MAAGGRSQGPAASSPLIAQPGPVKTETVSFRPRDAVYPEELADNGVQGMAEVLVQLSAEGVPSDVSVFSTSRSTGLDQAAMKAVKKLRFKSGEPGKALTAVVVPVEFKRDSVNTLSQKTCAEFNVDVSYFKTTFPEQTTRKMDVINMSVGVIASFGLAGLSQDKAMAYIRKLEAAAKGIVDACAANPEAAYMKTFAGLVESSGGR